MTNEHLTSEVLQEFHENLMTGEETKAFMAHIGQCDHCAKIFGESFTDDFMHKAPKDLKVSVMDAARKTSTSLSDKAKGEVYKTSKQFKLFLYSLKVSGAVLAALFLLFSGVFNFTGPVYPEQPPYLMNNQRIPAPKDSPSLLERLGNGTNKISNSMKNFSNQLINMEETNYD